VPLDEYLRVHENDQDRGPASGNGQCGSEGPNPELVGEDFGAASQVALEALDAGGAFGVADGQASQHDDADQVSGLHRLSHQRHDRQHRCRRLDQQQKPARRGWD